MSKPIYGEAQVIAFPNLTALQAIQVARDTERDLVQTRTGNFYLAERKVYPTVSPRSTNESTDPEAA